MENYFLYSLCLFFIVIATVFILTRHIWQPYLPAPLSTLPNPLASLPFTIPTLATLGRPRYTRVPSSFSSDAALGLSSTSFSLSGNIEAGDSRGGLDERAKAEVLRVMKTRGVGFDEARRLVVMEKFRKEGIDADGSPRDPKFVSFS